MTVDMNKDVKIKKEDRKIYMRNLVETEETRESVHKRSRQQSRKRREKH